MWVHIGSEGQIKNLKNNLSFKLTIAFKVWKFHIIYVLEKLHTNENIETFTVKDSL